MRHRKISSTVVGMMLLLASIGLHLPRSVGAENAAPEIAQDPQGLTLTFENLQTKTKNDFPDARNSRLVSLYVPQGTAPSSFTPPGPFRATFEGDINVRLRTYLKFSAEGRGKLTLSIGGKPVLESSAEDLSKGTSEEIRLGKGKNHLVATYESPATGDANFRLLWLSKTWQPEPVPPNMFTHNVGDPGVATSLRVREGRFLVTQFRCLKCHTSSDLTGTISKDAMPELAMDAPSLSDIGDRLNRQWMSRWVLDPRSLRPDSHMPKLLNGPSAEQSAHDIAAYLGTLRSGANSPASTEGNAKNGGRIFANLDCVACHVPPDGKADSSRVPLREARAKFRPTALRQYLLQPEAHYAWNPMPNFHLSDSEASDLAAYLAPEHRDTEQVKGDATVGQGLVESAGCLNCHQLGHDKSTAKAPALNGITGNAIDTGCLAQGNARGTAPDFGLSPDQRAALAAFLQTDRQSLKQRCAPEFAERQVAAMRCTACHSRDGNESLLAQSLDAESAALHQKYPNPSVTEHDLLAADQRPPLLTWTGEKLRPQWMAQFIAGRISYKPRYYLRARMPAFSARAELLATGIAEEHGCPPTLPPIEKSDAQQAEIGRQLCGKVPNQGFSCVQCHAVADLPPFAAFEAPSINFKYAAERLRHNYYNRWIHDPQRIDPNTKMPRFDDGEGKTGLPTFDNNSQKQFDAIWQYLLQGQKIKPPG